MEGREPGRRREAGLVGTAVLDVAQERVNWTEKEPQKWESMALERCVAGTTYEMRLVLLGIYERRDAKEARRLFRPWCGGVHAMRG